MKTIIAGSRHGFALSDVNDALRKCPWSDTITEVVSGKAPGVDTLGEIWAKQNLIKVIPFPADWSLPYNSGGHKRNQEMADYADALIAIWDGKSSGTEDMIKRARKKGLVVYIHIPGANTLEEFT